MPLNIQSSLTIFPDVRAMPFLSTLNGNTLFWLFIELLLLIQRTGFSFFKNMVDIYELFHFFKWVWRRVLLPPGFLPVYVKFRMLIIFNPALLTVGDGVSELFLWVNVSLISAMTVWCARFIKRNRPQLIRCFFLPAVKSRDQVSCFFEVFLLSRFGGRGDK